MAAEARVRFAGKVRILITVFTGGVAAYKALPYFVENSHCQLSSEKYEELPEGKRKEEIERLVSRIKLKNADRLKVVVSRSRFSYPESHGCLSTRGGAYIALPRYFLADAPFQSPSLLQGVELIEYRMHRAMLPSEEMRLFVLAHELSHVQRGDSLLSELLQPLGFLLSYHTLAHGCFVRFMSTLTLGNGMAMSLAVGGCLAVGHICVALFSRWSEKKADEDAALLDEAFARGGIQFCNKCTTANLIVRDVNALTPYVITEAGENRIDFNNPPLTVRRKRLEKILAWWTKRRTRTYNSEDKKS